MTEPSISQLDLERTVGASTVARFFDDDGDGAADASTLDEFLRRATARARGMLMGLFTEATYEQIEADERFVDAVCWIALGLAAQRRPEWMLPDGSFPYSKQRKEAETELAAIARGADKFAAQLEPGGGGNEAGAGPSRAAETYGPPIFAASREYTGGRGGF